MLQVMRHLVTVTGTNIENEQTKHRTLLNAKGTSNTELSYIFFSCDGIAIPITMSYEISARGWFNQELLLNTHMKFYH